MILAREKKPAKILARKRKLAKILVRKRKLAKILARIMKPAKGRLQLKILVVLHETRLFQVPTRG